MTNLEYLIFHKEKCSDWMAGVLCEWYSGDSCRGCPMVGKQLDDCYCALLQWLAAEHEEVDND